MTRDGKSGEKRSRKDNEVFCSNCKRYGNHVEDECQNLEKNKAKRPSWNTSLHNYAATKRGLLGQIFSLGHIHRAGSIPSGLISLVKVAGCLIVLLRIMAWLSANKIETIDLWIQLLGSSSLL
ncbi:hypothetical protein MP228_008192 [Amoeboaphelidium protococcarum]|nr:hypothetical protein MP228_008192 [Amoeboaphelidium protococcarum]